MWHILRLRHHINIPRRLVASIMKEVDPDGVALRKHGHLNRRTYVSDLGGQILRQRCTSMATPNSKLMVFQSMVVLTALDEEYCAKAKDNCEIYVYNRLLTDRGTENGLIAAMQCYLRANGQDEFARPKAHHSVFVESKQPKNRGLLVFTTKATFLLVDRFFCRPFAVWYPTLVIQLFLLR